MSLIPYNVVEKILLDIPNSSKVSRLSSPEKIYFNIDDVIVKLPNSDVHIDNLLDILQSQLGMSWWMIDYLFGQNNITP